MRALVVHPGADFSVADVFDGWVSGLAANGLKVAEMNLNDRLQFYGNARMKRGRRYVKAMDDAAVVRMAAVGLKAACYDWWPDVIVVVSAFFVPADFYPVFRDRGHKVVIIHTESPYEDDRQIERAAFADLNIINDPTNIERFREVAPTIYLPHAYDPERHHIREPEPELASDFCFVGTGYPSRIAFLEAVDWTGLDVALAGNWQATAEDSPLRPFVTHDIEDCCPNDETVRLYASTKASANIYRREAQRPELVQGWAMTPREVELAACGVFFLRESRGEGDEVLPMLPRFSSPQEFGELLRFWVNHDEMRDKAVAEARNAVADRTFDRHAALMLQAL